MARNISRLVYLIHSLYSQANHRSLFKSILRLWELDCREIPEKNIIALSTQNFLTFRTEIPFSLCFPL